MEQDRRYCRRRSVDPRFADPDHYNDNGSEQVFRRAGPDDGSVDLRVRYFRRIDKAARKIRNRAEIISARFAV